MLWSDQKEYRYQSIYKRLKGTPLEEYVNRLRISIDLLYSRKDDNQFWRVLCSDAIRDTRCNQRRARVRRYVRGMIDTFEGNTYLLTLTFDDRTLACTCSDTRLRYVKAWLSDSCLDYFACIDFGKKSNREHYHAIVALSPNSVSRSASKHLQCLNPWPYGFHSLKPLKSGYGNVTRSCSYAFKASNYAFKSSDSSIRPFHARGIEHIRLVRDDFDIAVFERVLDLHSPNWLSSGFEVASPKKNYDTPYCWIGVADFPSSLHQIRVGLTETILST